MKLKTNIKMKVQVQVQVQTQAQAQPQDPLPHPRLHPTERASEPRKTSAAPNPVWQLPLPCAKPGLLTRSLPLGSGAGLSVLFGPPRGGLRRLAC